MKSSILPLMILILLLAVGCGPGFWVKNPNASSVTSINGMSMQFTPDEIDVSVTDHQVQISGRCDGGDYPSHLIFWQINLGTMINGTNANPCQEGWFSFMVPISNQTLSPKTVALTAMMFGTDEDGNQVDGPSGDVLINFRPAHSIPAQHSLKVEVFSGESSHGLRVGGVRIESRRQDGAFEVKYSDSNGVALFQMPAHNYEITAVHNQEMKSQFISLNNDMNLTFSVGSESSGGGSGGGGSQSGSEIPQASTEYPRLNSKDEQGAILEAATWVRNHSNQFFQELWLDEPYWDTARAASYHMMTQVINILRSNCHDVGRVLNHHNLTPENNPYRWGSDALIYKNQNSYAVYDIYGTWPFPAIPHLGYEGQAPDKFNVTDDLVRVPTSCP